MLMVRQQQTEALCSAEISIISSRTFALKPDPNSSSSLLVDVEITADEKLRACKLELEELSDLLRQGFRIDEESFDEFQTAPSLLGHRQIFPPSLFLSFPVVTQEMSIKRVFTVND